MVSLVPPGKAIMTYFKSMTDEKELNGRCREIIYNVLTYFNKENDNTKVLLKTLMAILSVNAIVSL